MVPGLGQDGVGGVGMPGLGQDGPGGVGMPDRVVVRTEGEDRTEATPQGTRRRPGTLLPDWPRMQSTDRSCGWQVEAVPAYPASFRNHGLVPLQGAMICLLFPPSQGPHRHSQTLRTFRAPSRL